MDEYFGVADVRTDRYRRAVLDDIYIFLLVINSQTDRMLYLQTMRKRRVRSALVKTQLRIEFRFSVFDSSLLVYAFSEITIARFDGSVLQMALGRYM